MKYPKAIVITKRLQGLTRDKCYDVLQAWPENKRLHLPAEVLVRDDYGWVHRVTSDHYKTAKPETAEQQRVASILAAYPQIIARVRDGHPVYCLARTYGHLESTDPATLVEFIA